MTLNDLFVITFLFLQNVFDICMIILIIELIFIKIIKIFFQTIKIFQKLPSSGNGDGRNWPIFGGAAADCISFVVLFYVLLIIIFLFVKLF